MAAAEAMLSWPVSAAASHRESKSSRLSNGGEMAHNRRRNCSVCASQISIPRCSSSSTGSATVTSSSGSSGSSSSSSDYYSLRAFPSGSGAEKDSSRSSAALGLGGIVGFWGRNELRERRRRIRVNRIGSLARFPGGKSGNNSGNGTFVGGPRFGTLTVKATSSSYEGVGSLSGDARGITSPGDDAGKASEPLPGPRNYRGSLQAVGILAAILGIGSLAALALTLNTGGSDALLSMVSKSGFPAAFALIFVSEIGDKTFFIAALLAMRHSKWLVLVGASGALGVMTVISVIIGKLFQKVPAQLQTTHPVGEYAAVALLIWFGLRSIKSAWDIPSASAGSESEPEEVGELAEAEEFLKSSEEKKAGTPLEVLAEAFTLIFVAEWGDRSMLATIALGAAQSPWGVATGAIAGHVLATLLAVIGGALLARYLSEKLIGYFGGFLFLGFAAATLAGVF